MRAVVKVQGTEALNAAVAETGEYEWTFDQLAGLGEFSDDPDAIAEIKEAATRRFRAADHVDYAIEVERTKRKRRKKAEAHRAELEKAGQKIRDVAELSERATRVSQLRTYEGERISPEGHAGCKGQVWALEGRSDDAYTPYCTSPALYEHAEPGNPLNGGKSAAQKEAEKAARAAVKRGNVEWDAAEGRRRQWIADLVKRRSLTKETANTLTGYINAALLDGTWGIGNDLNSDVVTQILATLLGLTDDQAEKRSAFTSHASKDPRRAVQLQFAAVAAVREKSAPRGAWRTDDQHAPWVRTPTLKWFKILESLGYPLSPIERSVAEDEPYDPFHPKGEESADGQEDDGRTSEGEPAAMPQMTDEPAA